MKFQPLPFAGAPEPGTVHTDDIAKDGGECSCSHAMTTHALRTGNCMRCYPSATVSRRANGDRRALNRPGVCQSVVHLAYGLSSAVARPGASSAPLHGACCIGKQREEALLHPLSAYTTKSATST